jgi:hypothetical protein
VLFDSYPVAKCKAARSRSSDSEVKNARFCTERQLYVIHSAITHTMFIISSSLCVPSSLQSYFTLTFSHVLHKFLSNRI